MQRVMRKVRGIGSLEGMAISAGDSKGIARHTGVTIPNQGLPARWRLPVRRRVGPSGDSIAATV